MLKKIFLGLFVLLFMIALGAAIVLYIGLHHKRYDVKADLAMFPDIKTAEDIEQLAEKLLGEMTLEEKLSQMWGEHQFGGYVKFISHVVWKDEFPLIYVGGNERLNIPPWAFSDGPRGAVVGNGNTAFPVAMARGASWDLSLEARVADVIGKEIRANGANYTGSPCINLLMHPSWGRAQETYGEDPYLMGEMAVAFTKAVQSHHVMACPKHYALNNIENSRFYVDVDLGERTLREVYLPHFKKVVQQGQAASLMSAYNQFRGDYVSHSRYLLTDILRKEWGFEGFVSSDWIFAVRDGVKAVKAGLDVEMPFRNHYGEPLEKAIQRGEVSLEEIDEIVLRILKTRLKYAFAPDRMTYGPELKASQAHISLAREAAEKSMVLLKNQSVLPWKSPQSQTVAVVGEIANIPNTGDRGSSNVRTPYVATPFQGIYAYVTGKGGKALLYDGKSLEEAARVAAAADQVVVVVGFTHRDEGEYITLSPEPPKDVQKAKAKAIGGDRENLRLTNKDVELIRATAAANPNTVVVIVTGSAVVMSEWENEVPAILYGWYAGTEGGNALARVLYGEVNPSGKLPFSIPTDEKHLPPFDAWAETAYYGYFHGYTLLEKNQQTPSYPFGFGLSYTNFVYSNATFEKDRSTSEVLVFSVDVQNTGEREGEEVSQLYIGFANASVERPLKLLKGFQKNMLRPGELKKLFFTVPVDEIMWYNPEKKQWELEQMVHEFFVGGSSKAENLLQGTFEPIP
jgi:beta-glucosidase